MFLHALIGNSNLKYPVLFTSKQCQTHEVMSKMASQFVTVTNKEISQLNKGAVPDNTKMVEKFGLAVLTGFYRMIYANVGKNQPETLTSFIIVGSLFTTYSGRFCTIP